MDRRTSEDNPDRRCRDEERPTPTIDDSESKMNDVDDGSNSSRESGELSSEDSMDLDTPHCEDKVTRDLDEASGSSTLSDDIPVSHPEPQWWHSAEPSPSYLEDPYSSASSSWAAPPYTRFPRATGQQICQYWLEGNCPRSAEECDFEHEGEVVKIFEKCKFYLSKGCKKGKACPFLHEVIPCTKFHLLGECDSEKPCGFSHEAITDQTWEMFEEEVIFWRNRVESQIEEEEEEEVEGLKKSDSLMEQKDLLERINRAIKKRGVKDPDEDVESELFKDDSKEVEVPCGRLSKRRFVQGTFGNFQYAQKNAARFEAYDEMERRARKLYDEISIDNYDSLSARVRCLD